MIETELLTKDGELVVIFHEEPITEEELSVLRDFTSWELKTLLMADGFKEYRYE